MMDIYIKENLLNQELEQVEALEELETIDIKRSKITPPSVPRCVQCGKTCLVYWFVENEKSFCKNCKTPKSTL